MTVNGSTAVHQEMDHDPHLYMYMDIIVGNKHGFGQRCGKPSKPLCHLGQGSFLDVFNGKEHSQQTAEGMEST